MTNRRQVEVFRAGCPACEPVVQLVQKIACPWCDVKVLDMHQPDVAAKAKQYGVTTVPAVVIDGQLASCCTGTGPNEEALRAAGLGVPE
jgi:glutaredoxin 3